MNRKQFVKDNEKRLCDKDLIKMCNNIFVGKLLWNKTKTAEIVEIKAGRKETHVFDKQ